MQETWVRFLGREDSSGEGNGNPLQYSCLENPVDRGAWRATVHGVARVAHNWVTLTTTTNLQVQSRFVSISLRPVLGSVAVYVTATVRSSCCLTSSTWWGLQYPYDSSQDMAQSTIYSPWEETKGPWLYLVAKLLLFGLLWLFSFVPACSHFSD